MKKRVNIKINGPIYTVKPIIQRSLMNVEMTEGDIRNCICSNAMVEEILEDGSRVPLGLHNYNKDNRPKKKVEPKKETVNKAPKPQPKPEPKKEAVNVKVKEDNRIKEEVKKPEPVVEKKPYEKPTIEIKEQPVVQPKEEVKKETKEEKK